MNTALLRWLAVVVTIVTVLPGVSEAFSIAGSSADLEATLGKPLSILWSRCPFQNRSGLNTLEGPLFRHGFASLHYCFSMSKLACRGSSCGDVDSASLPCDPLDTFPASYTDGSTISCASAANALMQAYVCRVGRGPESDTPFSSSIRNSIVAFSDSTRCTDGVSGQSNLIDAVDFVTASPSDNYLEASCSSKGANATIRACSSGPYAVGSAYVRSAYNLVFAKDVCDAGLGLSVSCSYCQPYIEEATVVQPYYFLVPPAIKMTFMVLFDLFIIDRIARRVRRRIQRFNREKAAPIREHNDVFVEFIIRFLLKNGTYSIGLKRTSVSLDGLRNLKKLKGKFDNLVKLWQEKRIVTLEQELNQKRALKKQAKKLLRNRRSGIQLAHEPISLPTETNPDGDSELTVIEDVETQSNFDVLREAALQKKRRQEAKQRRIDRRLAKGKSVEDIHTDDCSTSSSDEDDYAPLQQYTLQDLLSCSDEKVFTDEKWLKYTAPIKGIHLRKALYNRQTIVGTYRHIISRVFKRLGVTSLDAHQEALIDHELEWFWNNVCLRGERLFDGLESFWASAFQRHWTIMCRPQLKYHVAHETEDTDDDVDVVMYFIPDEDDTFELLSKNAYRSCHNNMKQTEYVISCEEDDKFVTVIGNLYLLLVEEGKFTDLDPDDIQIVLLDGTIQRVDYSMTITDLRALQMKALKALSERESVPLTEYEKCPNQFLPLRFNVITDSTPRVPSYPSYFHLPTGYSLYKAHQEFLEGAAFTFPVFEKESLFEATDNALAKLLDSQFSKLIADKMLVFAGEEVVFDYLVKDRYVYRDAIPQILALKHTSKANALGISEDEAMGHILSGGVVHLEDESKADTLYCMEVLLISKTQQEVQAEQEAASKLASPTIPSASEPVDSSVRAGAFGVVDDGDPETIMAKNLSSCMKEHFNQLNDTLVTIYDTKWLDEQRLAQRRLTVVEPATPVRPAIFMDENKLEKRVTIKDDPAQKVDDKVARALVQQELHESRLMDAAEGKGDAAREIYNEVYEELTTIIQDVDGEKRLGMHLVFPEDKEEFLKTLSDLYTAVTIRLAEAGGDKTCVSSHHLAFEYREQVESLSVLMPIVTKEEQVTFTIFYVNANMLVLEIIFAIVFLITCIRDSYSSLRADDDNWAMYESIYFKFLNSGTPAALISATITNFIVNQPNRLKSYYYKIMDSTLVIAAVILCTPAFLTHSITGLALYLWIFLAIFGVCLIPNVFIWVLYRRLRVSWTADDVDPTKRLQYHQRLKMIFTGILIWFNFVMVVILTGLTQSTYNWAHLFYHRKEMGLDYASVLSYEWESRSPACYLERQMTSVSNVLQFLSSFI